MSDPKAEKKTKKRSPGRVHDLEASKERLKARGLGKHAAEIGSFAGGDEATWRYFGVPVYQPDKKRKPEHVLASSVAWLEGLEYERDPDGVYVVGIPDAIVMRTPRPTWEWRKREYKRHLAAQKWWADQQMARIQPGHGFMPTQQELAEPEQ